VVAVMMARWYVYLIRKKMQHIGRVLVDSEKQAIEEAIKEFAIEPALRNKVVVTKISDRD
jgi:hypothetical protein